MMVPYICIYIISILMCGFFSYFGKKQKYSQQIFLLLCGALYSLLCGLRASSVGYDTDNYYLIFKSFSSHSELWKVYASYLEPGFVLLNFIIIKLGGDIHVLLLCCSTFIVYSTLLFLYRYAKRFYFSVFILVSFPFFLSSMDILRFFLAISIYFYAVKYAIEKKPLRYILITLLAAQFHKMLYLFVLFYFFIKLKWGKIAITITLIFTTMLLIMPNSFVAIVSDILGRYNIYANENAWAGMFSGGVKTAVMYAVIYIIYLKVHHKCEKIGNEREQAEDNFFHSSMVVLLISSVVFINMGLMIRMILAMQPFMAVAIGNVTGVYSDEQCKFGIHPPFYRLPLFKAVMIGICLLYYIFLLWSNWQNVIPYIPYWLE